MIYICIVISLRKENQIKRQKGNSKQALRRQGKDLGKEPGTEQNHRTQNHQNHKI